MTVPAFSLPAILHGAPPIPTGTDVAAPPGNGGLFEGLLAGAIQAEQDGGSAAGAALDDQRPVEAVSKDETDPASDAGAILMLFTAVAPLADFTAPGPSDTVEAGETAATALAATGPGRRAFGFSPAPTVAAARVPGANDTLGAISATVIDGVAEVAEAIRTPDQTEGPGDQAGLSADNGETDSRSAGAAGLVATGASKLAFALAATPGASSPGGTAAARPAPAAPVAVAAQAAVQSVTITPVPVTPVVVAPPPAAKEVATAEAADAIPPLASAKATSTDGDTRRAPGAARPERRDGAGRPGQAGIGSFAPKSDLLATTIAASTSPATGPADAGSDAATDPVALDLAEAPETRQPALVAETRAQATPATAATLDAAAVRGSPETVAKMAADIVRKLDGQSTRFDLQLDPLGMGKVDVAIEIDRDGKLTAAMSFDSARSASDLRGRAGELRLALEQAGFEVAEGGLTFDLSGQGPGLGGREAGQQERAWNGRAFQRAQSGADEADLSLAATPSTPSRWTRSGVDIRI